MLASSFVICDINNPYMWLQSSCYLLQTYISFAFILSVQYLCAEMEGKYADIVVNCNKGLLTRYCLIVTQKSTLFFFGTSEKQMVNVNASCLPETAGLRLNLLSFFFHANFLSVGYRYWDISQMNRDKLEKARFYSFHDTNFLYLFLVKAAS